MRKTVTVVSAVCLLLVAGVSATALANRAVTGVTSSFVIHEKPEINGTVTFLDTGGLRSGLFVSGEARGMNPANTYVSLIYNIGSVTEGPAACTPTNGLLDGTQMLVGFWQVDATGRGKLFANKLGESYAPLTDVGAISIREVRGPAPGGFVLQSCGKVEIERGRPPVPPSKMRPAPGR